ncbi:MAG: YfjI family protein, partial [Bacilli bacterium]
CNPPLSTSELNTIWKQALKYYGEIQKQPDYLKPEDYGKESFDEIIPLPDVVLPSFPINVLAPAARDYCLEVAESTQTPPDMAFVSALAILALAMQKNYKVVGKTDWEEQLSLYVMIVAEPSDRKSAVLNQMVKVIHAFEANYNNSHQTELQKNHDEYNRLKNHKAKILKDLENNKATQEDYDAVVDKLVNFKLLNSLNLTLDDVTTESIAENMSTQNGCISIVSSEGGMVDIISGLYSKLVNLDIYLKGYSGDSLKVDRIGRDSLYIPNPRLTILLTVQPKVLENFITNPTFEGRGLTARFLYSIPKSLVGSRKFNTEPIKYESKQAFISLVNEILNESGQATTYIHLSDEATTLLEEYHNKFELRLATDLKEMGSWAGKLLGNILRLSAIITRARGIKYDEFLGCKPSTDDSAVWIVQKDDMANAIKVGEYFLEHAECAFNLLGVDQKTKDAKTLIKVIKEHKPELTEVNARIIARITSKIGKKDRIAPVLSMLADYGYLKEKQQTYVAGRPRSETYLVNPKIYIDDGEPP